MQLTMVGAFCPGCSVIGAQIGGHGFATGITVAPRSIGKINALYLLIRKVLLGE
jgi:hypothetical protein